MIFFPKAKINLGLYIQGKRSDGYHNILTYMHSIDFCDIMEIMPSDNYSKSYSGLKIESAELVDEMAKWLIEKSWLRPVSIHLHKTIPMGSGLGGASSDLAAFTKYALSDASFSGSKHEVVAKMIDLSTDSYFFYKEEEAIVSGKGDLIQGYHVDLKGYQLFLVIPPFVSSTYEAFNSVRLKGIEEVNFKETLGNMENWKGNLNNVFEGKYSELHPEFTKIKEYLYGCGAEYVSLTGSGSAFYGIFKERKSIELETSLAAKWITL